jgi:autoinducer-2 kinase
MSIDAGTGSIRAVLFDEEGREISIAQREWGHHADDGVVASMGFDYDTNWILVVECINESIIKGRINPAHILAVTASSMREGIVLYDKNGKELWAVANVDARAYQEVIELKGLWGGIEEEFYKESGQTFALGALPRLLWVKKHRPDIYDKTTTISMISDWVLARLGGVIATDPSNGGTTGIFSLSRRDWERSQARKDNYQ